MTEENNEKVASPMKVVVPEFIENIAAMEHAVGAALATVETISLNGLIVKTDKAYIRRWKLEANFFFKQLVSLSSRRKRYLERILKKTDNDARRAAKKEAINEIRKNTASAA